MHRMLRTVTVIAAVGLTAAACTPQQIQEWTAWYSVDPAGATEYANLPAVQEHLRVDWDQDGIMEPDPVPEPEPEPDARPTAENTAARTSAPAVSNGSVWDRLAQCESGGNWSINTGNGFYGGLQFTVTSWRAAGGSGMPHQNSREEQIRVAENLQNMQGWGAWPACASKLGLR